MKNYRRLIAAALTLTVTLLMACTTSAGQAPTKEVRGLIVQVTDGDTVTLLETDNTRIKIRLAGIDAPESRMPFGQAAQTHLAGLVLNKELVAVVHKLDRYGRTVATLLLGTQDINLSMVQAGMAWHYKLYARDQLQNQATNYAQSELVARTERRGLWEHENPAPPWMWRKSQIQPVRAANHAKTLMLTEQHGFKKGTTPCQLQFALTPSIRFRQIFRIN